MVIISLKSVDQTPYFSQIKITIRDSCSFTKMERLISEAKGLFPHYKWRERAQLVFYGYRGTTMLKLQKILEENYELRVQRVRIRISVGKTSIFLL